jgi:hypothetical protein
MQAGLFLRPAYFFIIRRTNVPSAIALILATVPHSNIKTGNHK